MSTCNEDKARAVGEAVGKIAMESLLKVMKPEHLANPETIDDDLRNTLADEIRHSMKDIDVNELSETAPLSTGCSVEKGRGLV